jgi:hypothetical protein
MYPNTESSVRGNASLAELFVDPKDREIFKIHQREEASKQ